jgi:hypothetical protein
MTTWRWMIAVAAIAAGLGAVRLKQQRDEYLSAARSHAAQERRYRSLMPSSQAFEMKKKQAERMIRALAQADAEPDDRPDTGWLGLPPGDPALIEADKRFREAQARMRATAVRSSLIEIDYMLREAEHHRRQAEYHAELGRKYAASADRHWLPVAPDPPRPK